MKRANRRPILVTGGIRTGTTWVGKVLALSPEVGFIMEPFNVSHRMGIFAHRWDHQFSYLAEDDEAEIWAALQDTLAFRYRPLAQIRALRSAHNAAGFLRDFPRTVYWRHVGKPRPLIKDPIALFSAERLARRFSMDVVVLIRHPAAFAWSYKRIGEPPRFADLLCQPRLMDELLAAYREQIAEQARRPGDPVEQAILMWNVFYSVVGGFRARQPGWIFAEHEQLSLEPEAEFEAMYARLDLDFSASVRGRLRQLTGADNPTDAPDGVRHQLKRNSKANVSSWRRHLSADEIERIRRGTREVACAFYPESSWEAGSDAPP